MLTESSRYNLGVAFSRSYRGHINWWILVAFVVCYSPLACVLIVCQATQYGFYAALA